MADPAALNARQVARRRAVKPLPVVVVEADEVIDLAAWTGQYAAIVIRLHQQDMAAKEAPHHG